jgi:hypothetical protein
LVKKKNLFGGGRKPIAGRGRDGLERRGTRNLDIELRQG